MKFRSKKSTPEQAQVYQTGPTAPPKSYGSLVAILLVLVILLGGLVSVLGIMNIRLLGQLSLEERDPSPIQFSPRTTATECSVIFDTENLADCLPSLGLKVETVTEFLQAYYDLPEGVYITAVTGNSAQSSGCIPGDIILTFNGIRIMDNDQLELLLQGCLAGQEVTLTLYRAGEELTVPLVLDHWIKEEN